MAFAGVSTVVGGEAVGHAINVSTASGYHLLVVNGYSRSRANAPIGISLASLPFMVGGYSWRILYYPNGASAEYADSVSVSLAIIDENVTEPVMVQCDFCFVEQLEQQNSAHIRAMKQKKFSSNGPAYGYNSFIKRDALEKSKHLKDDCFIIRCDLNIVTTIDLLIKVPASSIQQNISDLLLSKEGTDVTFKVGEDTFLAHRCMLAARSAVFKAELFGSMKEGTIGSVIEVLDMEANVFRALLGFVYTDSFPKIEIATVEEGKEAQEALWLQHFLAAADRYDLQRLKALCEKKLCEHISVSSVTAILAVAERHNCCGLKEICLEFVKTPANLKEITAADGLDDIIRTSPSLVKELIAKFVS
jgi:speckle-type POZ protein